MQAFTQLLPQYNFSEFSETIIIGGCGGVGSEVAFLIGKRRLTIPLVLCDSDIVEAKNTHNQMFDETHVGLPKTEALARQLKLWGAPPPTQRPHITKGQHLPPGVLILC